MYFACRISVTIGDKTVQTVSAVSVKNDSKEIGSTCKIVVPLACRIAYVGAPNTFLTDLAKNLFKSGDAVTVKAWYDGFPQITVFTGFVYEFLEGTPMTIECMDNIYLLNQTSVSVAHTSIKLRNLLVEILKGTGVTLQEPTIDLTLINITFQLMSPASILEYFKKELGLNISLNNGQIYCNIASNTVAKAFLDTRINVLISDLQKPEAVFLKLKVKAWFVQENGKKSSLEVGDPNGELREVWFYKIPFSIAKYQQMAAEALIKYKQMKFSGNIETLLYPDMALFWKVQYLDQSYPDRNGNYTVVGMDFTLDRHGFHRKIKLAYLSDIDSTVNALAATNDIVNLAPNG